MDGGSVQHSRGLANKPQVHKSKTLAVLLRREAIVPPVLPVERSHLAGAIDSLSLFYDFAKFPAAEVAHSTVVTGAVGSDPRIAAFNLRGKHWTVSPACGLALHRDGTLLEAAALLTPKNPKGGPERILCFPSGLSPAPLATSLSQPYRNVKERTPPNSPGLESIRLASQAFASRLDRDILQIMDRFKFRSIHLYNLLAGKAFSDLDQEVVIRNITQALERFPALARPISTLTASRSIAQGSTVPAAIVEGIVETLRWKIPVTAASSPEIRVAKSFTPEMIRRLQGIDPGQIDPVYLEDPFRMVLHFNRVPREHMPKNKVQCQVLHYLHMLETIPDDNRPWLRAVRANTLDRSDYRKITEKFDEQSFTHLKDYLGWLYRLDESNGGLPRAAHSLKLSDLLRASDYWHERYPSALQRLNDAAAAECGYTNDTWKPLLTSKGLAAVAFGKYRFEEICDRISLIAEGKAMNHCVGDYTHWCVTGRIRVFRMVCADGSVATLSVTVSPEDGIRLHQFYGYKNRPLPDRIHKRVSRWISLLSADVRKGAFKRVVASVWAQTMQVRKQQAHLHADSFKSLPASWAKRKRFLSPFLPFKLTSRGNPVVRKQPDLIGSKRFEWSYK